MEGSSLNRKQDPIAVSSKLGNFMGNFEDVLGFGIYDLKGEDLFTSVKDISGDVGLVAFKTLLSKIGDQITAILPTKRSIQFIAPNNILVGVTKISTEQLLAVILKRNAQISNIIPGIVEVARLLEGITEKVSSLSNDTCLQSFEKTITQKPLKKSRANLINRFGA
ncbi:hypothetical protein EU523_00115 [Candidatus Heimdallarchaeota archaeon]|nr:MAG: hypothetical protein EU523_00115 [Candidatus Heimdallarchaeota archaeon]